MRPLALVIGAWLAAGCVPGPAANVTSPSAVASASATPTGSPSPSASPSATAGPINLASRVAIPPSFRYFSVGQGEGFRILLFDEDGTSAPIEVLRSGPLPAPSGPDVRSDAFSASADGRVIVVMRRLSEQRSTYSVVRPETGEVRALLSGVDLGPPVVSADGQRIAFARRSDDPAVNGLWLLAVTGAAAPTRLVNDDAQRVGSPPEPLAWSDDAKWLAISPALGPGGTEVAVVDPAAGETRFSALTNVFVGGSGRVLGSGYAVDWRAGEHALLITSARGAFGGRTYVYTAEVTSGPVRMLYAPAPDVVLGPATWHPSLDRYAITERPMAGGVAAPIAIWVRRLDGSGTKVAESPFLSPPWWSRDGTKLFSITGGDDSTGSITNLLGTGGGTIFCRRGGTPPRCA
jgi:hypothetical protein